MPYNTVELTTDDQQKIVNNAVKDMNKAHDALGKDHVYSLAGVRGCSRSCLVANSMNIRNRFNGAGMYVRSLRQAQILADAWGTSYQTARGEGFPGGHYGKGMKDFKAYVIAPSSMAELAAKFDSGDLSGIETGLGKVGQGFNRGENIYMVSSRIKKVSTVEMSVDDAIKLAKSL